MHKLGLARVAVGSVVFISAAAFSQATTSPSTQPAAGNQARPVGILNDAIDAYKAGRYDEAAKIALAVSKQIKRKPSVI